MGGGQKGERRDTAQIKAWMFTHFSGGRAELAFLPGQTKNLPGGWLSYLRGVVGGGQRGERRDAAQIKAWMFTHFSGGIAKFTSLPGQIQNLPGRGFELPGRGPERRQAGRGFAEAEEPQPFALPVFHVRRYLLMERCMNTKIQCLNTHIQCLNTKIQCQNTKIQCRNTQTKSLHTKIQARSN